MVKLPAKLRKGLPSVKNSGGVVADDPANLRLMEIRYPCGSRDGWIDVFFDGRVRCPRKTRQSLRGR